MGRITDAEINEAGGLRELAKQLLDSIAKGNMEDKERALATLWSLALQNSQNVPQIRSLSTIGPLASAVKEGSPVAQERAAGVLACLMHSNEEYQASVMESTALAPLASILRSGGGSAQEQAAAAFASLSEAPREPQSHNQGRYHRHPCRSSPPRQFCCTGECLAGGCKSVHRQR